MRWKSVLMLTGVYAKASRLITKRNFRLFKENRLWTYVTYAAAVVFGVLVGLGIGYLYKYFPDPAVGEALRQLVIGFFASLPTLSVLFTLFLTMMFQIQRSGTQASTQPIYWFPVTWEEHTAASALASLMTGILWIALLLCSGALAVAIPMGLLPLAALASLGLIMCIVMTSLTMEAVKALFTGLAGKVFKAAGRSAIWVRFFMTILVITVGYVAYFAFYQSSATVVFDAVSRGQLAAWFIPYVWPGVAVYAFGEGLWLETILFFLGSIIFTAIIFVVAARLNARYAFSETAAIRISSEYKAGTGFLGRLGVSPAESAILKKDFKAFTRRSELMYVFIVPIIMVVATFMPMITGNRGANLSDIGGLKTFFYLNLTTFPTAMLALMLGTSMIGMEGEKLWFLNASPASTKNFVRAKLMFPAILCIALGLAFCVIGYVIFWPSLRLAVTGVIETVLLSLVVCIISLYCGIVGADFREAPRPRMIRTEWRIACMLICTIAGLLVLLPVLVYGASAVLGQVLSITGVNGAYLYVAWILSAAIALAIAYISYRFAIRSADDLFSSAD